MIASLRGEVLSAGAGWAVIGVGGIGIRVEVPGRLAGATRGESLALHTQLVVREDSLTLFGFAEEDELEVFGYLLSVSGVGPRSALGILTELTPVQIASAVQNEDEKPFRKVSGIGPKTAKLIAVQLAGKLDPLAYAVAGQAVGGQTAAVHSAQANVAQGLIGLGYGEEEAETIVRDAVVAGAPEDEAGLLRAALLLVQSPRSAKGSGAR